jgi:putative oxygen-independent coproporphyrinogen III oxidase
MHFESFSMDVSRETSARQQIGDGMNNEDWRAGGFGLYLHWPFCESKCPYCDFNSHVAKTIDQSQWLTAYVAEIDRLGKETQNRILQSVYFGGGTPSLMDPDVVAAILEKIRATWRTSNAPEITLEANPSSIEAGRFLAYRDAGVNRISMGMQAMNDVDLRRLGRKHSSREALVAFDIARNCFERVSFDLIYARQDQDLGAWKQELQSALDLAIDHLSLYQLTVEDGTAFADRFAAGGLKGLPEEGLAADMYDLTQEICEAHGMPAYEVSNHARPGAESRHNLIYWQGGDYVGIGPGAHGRLTLEGMRYATEAPKSPALWLQLALNDRPAELPRAALSSEEHGLEYLLMSLRLSQGMDIGRYERVSQSSLDKNIVDELLQMELVRLEPGRILATAKGRILLNSVISKLAGA